MKVKDLIEALQGYDPEMKVFHLNVGNYATIEPDELGDTKLTIEKIYFDKLYNNFYLLRNLAESTRASVESFDAITIKPSWD